MDTSISMDTSIDIVQVQRFLLHMEGSQGDVTLIQRIHEITCVLTSTKFPISSTSRVVDVRSLKSKLRSVIDCNTLLGSSSRKSKGISSCMNT